MINIENVLSVKFIHSSIPQADVSKVTMAIVSVTDTEKKKTTMNSGFSVCVNGTRFVRKEARKRALTDALSVFDRPTRTRVWDAYWKITSP